MIQAFVGLVGGGKSFCSVRRMCSYMAAGGRCASNILLTGWDDSKQDLSSDSPVRSFLESLGWIYQPKQYVYISYDDMVGNPLWYERIPRGQSRDRRTLCVIDEATDLFDTLDGGKLRSDGGYRQLFHFLRLSRHAHIDVLFVCQDLNSINSRLRALVANIWRSTDMRNFKVGIFRLGFPVDCFMLQLFDRQGKYQIQREFVRKDPRIFGLYQSETFGGCLGVKWDGVSISADSGKIKKKDIPKMTTPYKLAFFALLGLSLFLLYRDITRPSVPSSPPPEAPFDTNLVFRLVRQTLRGDGGNHSPRCSPSSLQLPPVTNKASASSCVSQTSSFSDTSGAPSKPQRQDRFVRGLYEYGQAGSSSWIYFDGALIRHGCPSEFGRVVMVDRYFTACVDNDGNTTYLLPFDDSRISKSARRIPSARFTSSADGMRGALPWYYAHTGTNEKKVTADE